MISTRSLCVLVPCLSLLACGGSAKQPAPPPTSTESATADTENSPAQKSGDDASSSTEQAEPAEAASTTPECQTAKDCTIFSDCCTCKAIPSAQALPNPCEYVCGESKCELKGKTIDDVDCVAGRCTLKK